jgi:hypothetical protein
MNFSKVSEYIDDLLEKIKRPVYLWFAFLPFIAYLVSFFGIVYLNPEYIDTLKSITQIVIAIILLIRFNPMKEKHQLREYDETIIFWTALVLLANATLTTNFINYLLGKI